MDAFLTGILAQMITPEENDLLIAKVYNLRSVFGAGNTQDWLVVSYPLIIAIDKLILRNI